ncbi:B3 domain-containing protein Os01g0234100-like isoform X2 [Rhododendron vialii]|uniref:B3 domain-containing protein Os01g0234100-like isoform X2 n=1 Tax=Rhododendron vialii TaxID=182163 RepID=UPI00265F13CB|nr:B3 domain-containing protein Os01g0234100-like isoform X2 [Rhododendron vialii]
MDAQDQSHQTQMFTPLLHNVKHEPVEEHSMDVEDQLTLSQLLLFGKNLTDFPPKIVSDNPCSGESHKSGREMVDNVSDHFDDHFEAESQVMARAAEVQDSLAPEFPSFTKFMTRSHVTKGFWLGLPSEFCKSHLPRLDAIVILEDESGEEYNTKYLVDKKGLSAGWKWFSISHKLLEGDAVVFHLVSRLGLVKFKVYIVRAKDLEVADALSLPNSVACAKETGFAYVEKNSEICDKEEKKRPRLELDDESHPDWNIHSSDTSNTTEGSKFSGANSDIKDFNIEVNGITIDSLSTHVRTKYYDLCCNQKSIIHEGLFNANVAAGIISETVNIADAIRASQIYYSLDDFAIWDKTLEAFGLLGMDVGFLRDRLSRLMSLSSKSREGLKRYAETRIEREGVQKEMTSLELKLLGMKQDRRRLDDEMEDLEEEAQKYECLFQKEATAPW